MFYNTLLTCLALVHFSIAGYVLEDNYTPNNFFSMFDFFTGGDPTHGFVQYVNQGTAQSSGLISTSADSVYVGVDHDNVTPNGRPSVRLTSKKSYNKGLVILDLQHMPGSVCGTWPAFWMVGPSWPNNGEIDIIEGVNEQSQNAMTLHTGPGCSITNNGEFSGSITTPNCDINAPGQEANVGCGIATSASNTYGDGFNNANGGVYATEWTSSQISIYFFPRGSVPSDITNGSPNPAGWGKPLAQFQGGCNIDSIFKNQQIVFDTTFCGDWAGAVWSSGSCASKAATCQAFVQNNPSAFQNSYWTINSLKVYQNNGAGTSSNVVASSNPESATPSSVPVVESSTPASTAVPTTFQISTKSATPAPQTSAPTNITRSQSALHTPRPLESSDLSQAPATRTELTTSSITAIPFPAGNGTETALLSGSAGFITATSTGITLPTAAADSTARTGRFFHHHHHHTRRHGLKW